MDNISGNIVPLTYLDGNLNSSGDEQVVYRGYSAYEIALQQGFEGSKDEWLRALVGPQGETGVSISDVRLNPDFTLTITLDDGTEFTTESIKGDKGDKGQKGDKGNKGDTGNGISSAILNDDYTLTLTFTDGTTYKTPSIRGEKGEKGEPATDMEIHICTSSEYNATTRVPSISDPDEHTFYLVPSADSETTDMFVEWIYTNNAWEKFGSAAIALKHVKDDPSGNGGVIEGFIEFPKDIPYDPVTNTASGENAHAEGGGYYYDEIEDVFESIETTASGQASHAEGAKTLASGYASHAEGAGTVASGYESHAEGYQSTASGYNSHAEGKRSTASGHEAHAEGASTAASGNYSHAEGFYSSSTGNYSHAEGCKTEAKGEGSHSEGFRTIASSKYQHVQGQCNIEDTNNTYAEIVGNGRDINHRSNARTLDWNGNEKLFGGLTLGMGTNDETSLSASELKALKASAYLDEHPTNPTNPPVDTSLSIAGAAADAKKTGDELSSVKEDLNTYGAVITNDEIIKNGVGSNVSIPDDATVPYMVINSIDSDVTQLISRNKQLTSFDGVSINGSNLTSVFANNKITINGVFSGQNKHFGTLPVPFTFKAGHTYTLSAELVSGTATKEINFNIGDSSSTTLLDVAVTSTKKQKTKTFVSDATATKIGWGEYYPNAEFTDAVYAIQIEESSNATSYVDAEQYVYDNPQSGNIITIVIGGSIDLIGEQEELAYSFAFYKKSALNKRVITVKTDGSGDYTSLVDALKSVESDNLYEVQVFEGTYVLSDDWTAEELANANYPSGFCGTVVPSNCDLIGVGDKEKIIITAEANDNYTWNDTWRHVSTLNVEGGSIIKNLTIRNKGMRYTIHQDFPTAKGKITNYINCLIDKWGTPEGHAIGAGAHDGEMINIKSCVIKPAIGWHGHNPATIGATLNIEDTIIENCIELTDYLTGYAMPVNLTNVRCNAIVYNKYVANATQYMRISMHGGNTLVISSEDATYDMEGVEYKLSNTTIAKGKPVKKSTYFGRVEAMTQSDNQNLFYGVTMEELPYFQYDVTDYVFGRVITKGYVSTTLLGITGVSVGDEIGVTNGSFSIVSENGIGVIDYVIDNIGYMRIK